MKMLRIAAGSALSACFAMFAGCAGTAPAPLTPAQLKDAMNNVATVVAAGCTVVQPTLSATAIATANAPATIAAGANGIFCAANEAAANAAAASAASVPAAASAPVAAGK